jgi:hypothetical protein
MIAFFAQTAFATGSGFPSLPNGLLFWGGGAAVKQLGIEVLGIIVVMAVIFAISYATRLGHPEFCRWRQDRLRGVGPHSSSGRRSAG